MKKIKIIGLAGIVSLMVFPSCVKQLDKTFKGDTVVELDAAPLNSLTSGQTFTIFNRIPPHGIPVSTTRDSTSRRWSGIISLRVNLVGPQSDQSQTIGYKIFQSPVTTFAYPATLTAAQAPPTGQTPAQPAATLTVQNAIAGTHYTALSGICTIPPQSSFGYIEVNVLNAGATAGQARFIGIQLDSTGTLKPNPNYNKLGLMLDQR